MPPDRRNHGANAPEHRGPRTPGSWLAQQLDLTPQQQQQLDAIWSEVAGRRGRDQWARRAELRKERDEAIAALIPQERKAEYDRIHSDYEARVEEMQTQWRNSFEQAVEKTKAILTSQQRDRYDAILDRYDRHRDRDRERQRGSGPRRQRDQAVSEPLPVP